MDLRNALVRIYYGSKDKVCLPPAHIYPRIVFPDKYSSACKESTRGVKSFSDYLWMRANET